VEDLIIFADKWVVPGLVACAIALSILAIARGRSLREVPSYRGFAILAALVISAILIPMFGYWISGRTHPNALSGLLPWNDAGGYFNCARALADGLSLDSSFCQRRPHYTSYLTSLLVAARYDLQLALVLQALFLAAGIFTFVSVICARWGFTAALIAIATVSAFAGDNTITTLTENLGLILGVLALAFLLQGTQTLSGSALAAGAFLLTLALSARAGAFFVLPLLLLWPLLLGEATARARIWLTGFLLIAIMAGFCVGPLLTMFLGGGAGITHANFSYTIYGVVAGGRGWLHIYDVHPEFFRYRLNEGQIAKDVYTATWQLFLQSPELTMQGLMKGFLLYLERILKYVSWLPVRIIIVLCWLTGIVHILRNWRKPTELLLGLIALGIICSAPIIAVDGGLRVYASTIAADATIVSLGFFVISRVISRRFARRPSSDTMDNAGLSASNMPRVGWVLVTAVLLMVTLVPVLIRTTGEATKHRPIVVNHCAPDADMAIAQLGKGSPILPIKEAGEGSFWPVSPTAADFTARVNRSTAHIEGLRQATPGTTFALIYDLSPKAVRKTYVAMAQNMTVPRDGRIYAVCSEDWPDGPLEDVRKITRITSLKRSNDRMPRKLNSNSSLQ
jgi:hypothetical protein